MELFWCNPCSQLEIVTIIDMPIICKNFLLSGKSKLGQWSFHFFILLKTREWLILSEFVKLQTKRVRNPSIWQFTLEWLINSSIRWPFGVLKGDLTPCLVLHHAGGSSRQEPDGLVNLDGNVKTEGCDHEHKPNWSFRHRRACVYVRALQRIRWCGGEPTLGLSIRCFQQQTNWLSTYCERTLWVF